jgi:hypothetical protein
VTKHVSWIIAQQSTIATYSLLHILCEFFQYLKMKNLLQPNLLSVMKPHVFVFVNVSLPNQRLWEAAVHVSK